MPLMVPNAPAPRFTCARAGVVRLGGTQATWLALLAALALTGCKPAPAPPPAAVAESQVFSVTGIVTSVSPARKEVEIKHQEVPGYMPAMTMPFEVKDIKELSGLAPGQPVVFRLTVARTEAWIDQIRTTGPASAPAPPTTRVARDVEPLSPGDLFPEYHLTNQFNQPFSTRDFKGQALAITFLFTRCPYPTFCPRMTSEFQSAQQQMSARPAVTNWHLLTVTFDPDYDTPEVLKAYAQAHNYDPRHWSFATGTLLDITALGEQFGLAFWRDQPGGSLSHNLRTAVIDASGRVRKVFEGNTWTAEDLVSELVAAARR